MNLTLRRIAQSDAGTFGVLIMDEIPLCVTCELPWLDNQEGISCIPAGIYNCTSHDSPKHPNTWQVKNVPNRSEILIHDGNTIRDSIGCVVVGSGFGKLDNVPAVLNSKYALNMLRGILTSDFILTIVNP